MGNLLMYWQQGDAVSRAVALTLLVMSIGSWVLVFWKGWVLRRAAGDIARAEEKRLAARDLADELGLPIGNAVDFWTEASLFSAAGLTAFVYGPGDIAQAHTADEWVALEQLATAATTYTRLLEQTA